MTSAGRLFKISVLDLPTVPATAHPPTCRAAPTSASSITLDTSEQVLCPQPAGSLGLALGKCGRCRRRVNPEVLGRGRGVIRLEPGTGSWAPSSARSIDSELVFVTNDAQLLRPAASVRPQGRSGGGMAGIKLGIGAQWCSRSRSGERIGSRDRVWHVPGPARHRCRISQGHSLGSSRAKAEGPAAYAATDSSRAKTCCCSPGRDPHQRWLPRRAAAPDTAA